MRLIGLNKPVEIGDRVLIVVSTSVYRAKVCSKFWNKYRLIYRTMHAHKQTIRKEKEMYGAVE